MDRDCNQCVYSTRDGGCRKFSCEGTKTVEDIRSEVIEEIVKLVDEELTIDIGMDLFVNRDLLCERLEQLKDQKNE